MSLTDIFKKLYCKLFGHNYEHIATECWEYGDIKQVCTLCGKHKRTYSCEKGRR